MKRLLPPLSLMLAVAPVLSAAVSIETEQLRPADPAWKFHKIPGPSKSDVASQAAFTLEGNRWETAGADPQVLVNGRLPADSLDLSEEALLSNQNADGGTLRVDLGTVQPVVAIGTYSWHEWNVDDGSRGPQVYSLSGSADGKTWTKLADVDTRPNKTGAGWNGQHGVFIRDTTGKLGDFRYLALALHATLSPKQPGPGLTNTLFAEIDIHTADTLRNAGDATVCQPVKIEDVWVVFKTHLDIGYTDTIEAVLAKYRGPMMDGALKVVENSRNLPAEQRFSWTLAGWPLAHVLGPRQEPARKTQIEQAVREGAIAFHALPFTLHTETADLEDLVRGLGISSKLARDYGRPLPISGKMTDVPSHSWVWPTLLSHAGIRFLQLGCNGTSAFVRVPPLFWWEGPDGSRVLCNYTPEYGSGLGAPRSWPSKNYLVMAMTGDNHGPPSPAEVEHMRQQAAKSLPGVRVHFGTLDDFARAVLTESPDLPVVRGDMPDTWIHGWLSMPVEAKAAHGARPWEPAVETLDTELRAWGVTTPDLAPLLAEAYEQSNLFSEHTFGPWGPKQGPWESGISNRYIYGKEWQDARAKGMFRKYEGAFDDKRAFALKAENILRTELSSRLQQLAAAVKADGRRAVVFNALPWPRSGLVLIDGQPAFAKDVPACGYITLPTPPSDRSAPSESSASSDPKVMDTPLFTATFDLERGGVASLIEKSSGRELVDQSSPQALGQFVHERFDARQMLDFHNAYGRPGYSWPKGNLPADTRRAMLAPSGWNLAIQRGSDAVCATLSTTATLGLAKGYAISFTFPSQQAFVDVEWKVDTKTPDPLPEGGWLCFPLRVEEPRFLLGRLGGPIDPARDIVPGANRHYFCLNTGLEVSGPDGSGAGLCPIDSPCVSLGEPGLWKFSQADFPRKPAVFVNLYNNMWNTNFPEWIEGSWSSRVRLWPVSKRTAGPADLAVRSWEARLPLVAATADGPAGALSAHQAGLTVSRPGVLVTAFGPNPDGKGTVLRVWDQTGDRSELTITLPAACGHTRATPVNLRGEPAGDARNISGGRIVIPGLPAYAPASFILE